jgi:tetratricopeptide (TPR) repeat protein
MERAARALVEQRPDLSDNHRVYVEALTNLERFDDALAVARHALAMFPFDVGLRMIEVAVLMMMGNRHTDARAFEAARDKLLAMNLADSDWNGHLHLADCYLALGAWEAARDECRLVSLHNDQCGEARAIAAICSLKLGERQPASTAAEHATRRGEKGLLDLLHELDRRGELGTESAPPVPRWHRTWVFRA